MTNVIEAINVLISSTNMAYNRGVYSMKEVHDLYEAISFINQTINAQQNAQVPPASLEQKIEAKEENFD